MIEGVCMNSRYEKKVYLSFLSIHILYHASMDPIYGSWMIEELQHHGYQVGPSHIYPLLKEMVDEGLLVCEENSDSGRMRKYYSITEKGRVLYHQLNEKITELSREIHQKKESGPRE